MSRVQPRALVRAPSPLLAEGIVTHIDRSPVDVDVAREQFSAYCAVVEAAGWQLREVEPAPDHPDSVFVEDTVVVCDDLAVLTRCGDDRRRGELVGVERALAGLGMELARIEAPATLDGGDVLQVGTTVYVGRSGRTNSEGIRQLGRLLHPRGRTVVPVRLGAVLHLKSAATALPDGTMLVRSDHWAAGALPHPRVVVEEAGCHVVPLGGDEVLISAAAPRTAAELADLGFVPRVVDISEFEKLEGCVTCLSVLLPGTG
ncbi:N(G),N(G)-dimethylarginine dimethylaminohydrolase [Lipingzhangella sp. LS1_29]|uniref:N(G),N(G)-dimethylarginine dimethylaminohydrolase n=1 Tax=Lipingzhangella rawalii TaxID=2055835 RepID=A0ABU2H1E8_9ACTN|nr:dimethylargininase [Lipingzhangella rawalii]MDS1269116.1 N(G),N(G)-dimethylarginine dimethylaminohydrolase [Lipingzhangella rawalii]